MLHEVDLEVRAGEIHGLLGANGAGKSTLCKMIAGLVMPTAGSMTLDGQAFAPQSKQQAETAGVQIVQQELNLIPTLDVAHNLFFTRLPNRLGIIARRTLYAQAQQLLAEFGLEEVASDKLVSALGVGQQQMIEIAGTLSRQCQLLILDEPTAALSSGETQLLIERLRKAKSSGIGILVISHRLDEIQAWTDRVTILRDGRLVGTYRTRELTQAAMVQGMTTGDIRCESNTVESPASEQAPRDPARTVLKVSHFSRQPVVHDVSFSVSAGEILGIGGLVGAGRTELLRLIFGADQADSGSLELDGVSLSPFRSTVQAVSHGIAMVSEDRKADGLLLSQSITDNVVLSTLRDTDQQTAHIGLRQRWGAYNPRTAAELAQSQREQLRIHCEHVDQMAGTLSGGNQQKVVLAKWMLRGGKVFLFDEPTRGIDVAARQQVYELIRALAAQGKAIVLVSSDLEELMHLSHRIGILSAGRWTGEFQSSQFDRVELVRAMFQGYRNRNVVVPV